MLHRVNRRGRSPQGAAGRALCGLIGAALVLAPLAAGAAPGPGCGAWPGEPTPLPGRGERDPVRARWAELRLEELAQRARALEAERPLEAHRLWVHALCIDPESEEARAGRDRTQPVRVHRLRVEPGNGAPPRAASNGDPWEALAQPLRLASAARPEPAANAERQVFLDEIDGVLDQVDDEIRAARFEDAIAKGEEAAVLLEEMRWEDDLLPRWVRLHVQQATVMVALGREDEAREAAVQAIRRDPGLVIDPRKTSPKVRRVFEAARAERRR